MKISPEQKRGIPVYPTIKRVLTTVAASAAALVSCDRHVPGSVPSNAPDNRPTGQSTPEPDEPEEQPQLLAGDVPYVPDSEEIKLPPVFDKEVAAEVDAVFNNTDSADKPDTVEQPAPAPQLAPGAVVPQTH